MAVNCVLVHLGIMIAPWPVILLLAGYGKIRTLVGPFRFGGRSYIRIAFIAMNWLAVG